MQIIHGENTVKSRDQLFDVIQKAKNNDTEIIRLEAKSITLGELEETLGASDLFQTKKMIILEGLHSLPRSTKKNDLINLVSQPQIHSVVLWEKRTLTKTMLKKFPDATNTEHKISKPLFSWLDSLGTPQKVEKKLKLLHDAIQIDGEYFCFIMLIRQNRLLLLAKTGGKIPGPGFMQSKLKKQANSFSLEELAHLHKKLLDIDLQNKTSSNLLNLEQQLDLLTTTL